MASTKSLNLLASAGILLTAGILIGLLVYLILYFVRFRHTKKSAVSPEALRAKNAASAIAAVVILLSGAAWAMNPGWIRVFMVWFCVLWVVPVVAYTAAFFLLTRKAAPFAGRLSVKIHMICTCVLYFASFAFIPDGGDTGGPYMFFMLIQHTNALEIGFAITVLALAGCVISMILQHLQIRRLSADAGKASEIPIDTEEK